MPILKVSENLYKEAMEVIRINITVLGDCPQCQGSNYRSGVCEDCAYISPEVMQAIQEWQESQAIQQKAAAQRFALTDVIEASKHKKQKNHQDDQCPECGKYGFSLECGNCGYDDRDSVRAKGLDIGRIEFTGVDPRIEKRRRFTPNAEKFFQRKGPGRPKKANSIATARIQEVTAVLASADASNLGALQDDSLNAANDDTTRMRKLLLDSAAMEAEQNAANPDPTKEQS